KVIPCPSRGNVRDVVAARLQAVCPGVAIDTARACADLGTPRGKFLAHSGRVVTTDLFLAAAGLDPLTLERAIPTACLRGIDPAPIALPRGPAPLLSIPPPPP